MMTDELEVDEHGAVVTPEIKMADDKGLTECEVCGNLKGGSVCPTCSEIEVQGFQPDKTLIEVLVEWVPFYAIESLKLDEPERCECCGKPCKILIHIRSFRELLAVEGEQGPNVFLKVCLTGRCGELLCGVSNWKSGVVKRALQGEQPDTSKPDFDPPRGLV